MPSIDAAGVLRQFDKLVEEGELFYTPGKPSFQTDEGFEFEFRLASSFSQKPTFTSTSTAQSSTRPPPSDGSDIDHSDPAFFVADVRGTHKLILNKFCLFRPQHLLLTLDPKRRQGEGLDERDFGAMWAVLRELDGTEDGEGKGKGEKVRHYAVYNGGKEAGSSRQHKHLQVLAQPRAQDGDLELVGYRAGELERLPVVVFFKSLKEVVMEGMDDRAAGKKLAEIAEEHYKLSREATGLSEEEPLPHNVMLTRDWMITVPRRRATLGEGRLAGHVVGCQGVLGAVWVTKEEQLKAWKEVGPMNVLRELCVERKG